MDISSTYLPENSHSWGDIINCCGGDQCLWAKAREKGSRSHCSYSLCCRSLRQIPSCPYDGWQPFWSGCLVFGITVDWKLRSIRSEWAAVPSALQKGPLVASALPRWKGGAINQPVWSAFLSLIIHLRPCSLKRKKAKKGWETEGRGGVHSWGCAGGGARAVGRQGKAGVSTVPTQWPSDLGARRHERKRGTTREATPSIL